jgi:Xaa-Pro dipeptidase
MNFSKYLEVLKSAPIPKELAFDPSEYRSRLASIRKEMAARELDALLVTDTPNVCYLSGYETFVPNNFAGLVITDSDDPTLQVAEFEIPGALLNGWLRDVRATRFNDSDAIATTFVGILKEKSLDGKRVGIEMRLPGYSIFIYEAMKAALPAAQFIDASDLVFKTRLVKSPAELKHMRKAAELARRAMRVTLDSIRNGQTENEIASVAYEDLAKHGSEYFSCQPCVSAAHRNGWIHTSQRGLKIKAGDTVMIELGAFINRYVGAVMHTAVVGEPSRDVVRLANASDQTLTMVRDAVRPGRTAHEVALEVKEGLREVSDEAYSTGMFGYSVGLSFPPTWREGKFMIAESVHEPLVAGMAFLTPITLRLPGKLGVGFTDVFAVTETGCEVLTARERSLHVVAA